jgi:hypothetical protein
MQRFFISPHVFVRLNLRPLMCNSTPELLFVLIVTLSVILPN